MKILIGLGIITALFALYAIWGREWLKRKTWPWSVRFFQIIEPIETKLWGKSETILWARFRMLLGVLLAGLTSLGAIDITPIMPLVPEAYQSAVTHGFNLIPLMLTFLAWMDQKLRNTSTMPTELVAVSDNPSPQVAAAMQQFEEAKVAAIATVAAEKQEPVVIPEKKE